MPNEKHFPIKAFPKESLALLNIRAHSAAQKQTRKFRRQKYALFYLEFIAKLNQLSPNFSKQQEVAKKRLKRT